MNEEIAEGKSIEVVCEVCGEVLTPNLRTRKWEHGRNKRHDPLPTFFRTPRITSDVSSRELPPLAKKAQALIDAGAVPAEVFLALGLYDPGRLYQLYGLAKRNMNPPMKTGKTKGGEPPHVREVISWVEVVLQADVAPVQGLSSETRNGQTKWQKFIGRLMDKDRVVRALMGLFSKPRTTEEEMVKKAWDQFVKRHQDRAVVQADLMLFVCPGARNCPHRFDRTLQLVEKRSDKFEDSR